MIQAKWVTNMKKLLLALLCILLVSCSSAPKKENTIVLNDKTNENKQANNTVEPTKQENNTYSLNDTVTVAGFEITFSNELTIELIDNEYSQYNGEYLIGIPTHVKNTSGESGSFNTLYLTPFGPDGNQTDTFISIETDNTLGYDGEMRDGAEKDSVYYIIYKGDGEYVIEFDDWTNKGELSFVVTK